MKMRLISVMIGLMALTSCKQFKGSFDIFDKGYGPIPHEENIKIDLETEK